jgi:hypothetical protein
MTSTDEEGLEVKITRGMRRGTAKLARRSEIVTQETLVAGIDITRKESVVVCGSCPSGLGAGPREDAPPCG